MIDISGEKKKGKVIYGILLPMGLRKTDVVKDMYRQDKGTLSGFYYDNYYDTFEEAKRAMIEGLKDPKSGIVSEAEEMSKEERAEKIIEVLTWKEPVDLTKEFKWRLDRWDKEGEAPPI